MNVQEELLQERIDPYLGDDQLSAVATEALGERVRVRGYEVLTGGCWNRVIGADANGTPLVLKVSPHEDDEKIIREYQVLKEFRAGTELPVPEPLLLDRTSRLMPGTMLVMSRIPGAVMHQCYGLLNYGQRRRITEEIADHLAALHTIRSTGFGGVELSHEQRREKWSDFWLPRFDQVLEEVAAAGVAPARLVDGARGVRPLLAPLLDIGTESTMTHYDVWSGNVMINVEANPPRVSGFIDVPGYYADYARELSFAMLFGVADRRFFQTYTTHHEIDDSFALRASIYNLKMNLRHIQMYPSEYYYQRGAAECLQAIEHHLETG